MNDKRPAPSPDASARRGALFRETPWETCERVVLAVAWALMPARAAGVPPLVGAWLRDLVSGSRELPDPQRALAAPPGFCGFAHDLSPPALFAAYQRGLYPGGHTAPVKWFSPPERCVLYFDETHIAKRLRRLMRQNRYRVTFDRDIEGVLKACAGRRDGRWHVTWLTPRIMRAYAELFDAGHLHTFEVWNEAGALVGGGFGVATGRVFSTDSQFSLEANTSKLGFTVLNWHLAKWGFTVNDGKNPTPTITEMGFRSIPRAEFLRLLAEDQTIRKPGRWELEEDAAAIADWQPAHTVQAAE